jgi:hypothetical protein
MSCRVVRRRAKWAEEDRKREEEARRRQWDEQTRLEEQRKAEEARRLQEEQIRRQYEEQERIRQQQLQVNLTPLSHPLLLVVSDPRFTCVWCVCGVYVCVCVPPK